MSPHRVWRSCVAALGLASALSLSVALGAPPELDPGFGNDGRATADAGGNEYGQALAVQPDGKIVVAGETSLNSNGVVFRLNRDGSPDAGFDGDGGRLIDFAPGRGTINAVALQPDGKILATGNTRIGAAKDDAAVFRLNEDGSPDLSFDADGAQTIDEGDYERASAVAVQPDGKVVVAGYSLGGKNAAVWRFTRTGAPDPSFGTGGSRAIDLGGSTEMAKGVAIQPDGKIVVAGFVNLNNVIYAMAARLTPNGAPDPSFGAGGITMLAPGGDNAAQAIAIQPDGKIVMAGETRLNNDATAYRLTPGGTPDPSFGVGGVARLDSGANEDSRALVLQSDGKILVAGETSAGSDAVVYRLRPDGSRDASFGDRGALVLGGDGLEVAEALALQADGKILVAGDDSQANQNVLVYRLLGDGRPATGPGIGAGPARRDRPAIRGALRRRAGDDRGDGAARPDPRHPPTGRDRGPRRQRRHPWPRGQ